MRLPRHWRARARQLAWLSLVLVAAAGCEQILGAEFGEHTALPGDGGSGGAGASGGSGGVGGTGGGTGGSAAVGGNGGSGGGGNGECEPGETAVGNPADCGIADLAAWRSRTCAVLNDGTIRCWGDNSAGALGNGSGQPFETIPVKVQGVNDATQVAIGDSFTCALRANGTVNCWGLNDDGQLGNGNNAPSETPVVVSGISDATDIGAGNAHACATLASDGSVHCWGNNNVGQLGVGDNMPSNTPLAANTISAATIVAAGDLHTCASLPAAVWCWGSGSDKQLGSAAGQANSPSPAEAGAATQLVAGPTRACILAGGDVQCWGDNTDGALGAGTGPDSQSPVVVALGAADAVTLATGLRHTCAANTSGELWCWGSNDVGQTTKSLPLPNTVDGVANAVAVVAGDEHTCVALADQSVLCFGNNSSGQLGNGSQLGTSTPTQVFGL